MLIIASFATFTGCAQRHVVTSPEDYEEIINSLAISPTGDTLVVVGKAYDYILHPPQSLVSALRSSLRHALTADFRNFRLDTQSDLHGQWTLICAVNGNASLSKIAEELGFEKDVTGRYVLKGDIEGIRYQKTQLQSPPNMEKTNQIYTIQVRRSNTYKQVSSLRESPVRWTPELTAVMIGFVIFLPLILLLNGPENIF